jgi:hypothetical protein
MTSRIRGMAFLGAARHVKTVYGPEMLDRIVRDAGPATQKTFAKRIDGLGLQPYDSFVGLLTSLDRNLGTGDLGYCWQFGDLVARIDLETIFKGYKIRPSPEQMIRACMPIWAMYTDGCGYMEAVDVRPERTLLRIMDFPEMAPSHCRLMEGWMTAAMDTIGVEVLPGAGEIQCPNRGGPFHEFSCQWRHRD